MSNIPNFDYLLVMPSGNVRGFEDIDQILFLDMINVFLYL